MIMLDGVNVLENAAAGQRIGQLRAQDPDGDALQFSLVDNAEGRFAIVDGYVVVANGALLDFETAPQHHITVQVSDGHGGVREAVFTIHVRDVVEVPPPGDNHEPTALQMTGNWIVENASNGSVVGMLQTIDPDQGDSFTYELLNNADGRFAIQNGAVVVADGSKIDWETAQFHWITVKSTDIQNHSIIRDFSVMVLDSPYDNIPTPSGNHAPVDLQLVGSEIHENAPNGSAFGHFLAKDPDGDWLTYALSDDADGRFVLHDDMLLVKDGSRLDFETSPTHEIKLRVTDSHGLSTEKSFTIHVLDMADLPPPADSHVPVDVLISGNWIVENAKSGTVIGLLHTIDPDQGDSFTYDLINNAAGRFAIHNGAVVVADGSKIDYEISQTHEISVRSTDFSRPRHNQVFHHRGRRRSQRQHSAAVGQSRA